MCSGRNFGLFRRLGIAPPTTVNKSAGLLSLNFCFFICREGSVPMPRVTMPRVSPTLAAPTLCPVYHGIIILCVLYNPKWHPKSPPRPNSSRYLPRLASKVRHRAICGSDNESREPVYLGQHCTPAFILLIVIACRNVVCWRCYGVGRLGTQKPVLLPDYTN